MKGLNSSKKLKTSNGYCHKMSMDLQSPPALFDLENGIGDEEQVADSEVLADDVVEIDMGKSIAFKQLFSTISEHFGITHSEYGYRCRSALFPYIAFKPTADNTGNFISRIRSSIKTKISNPNASLELDGNVPNDVREPDLCSTTLGHIKSINEKPDVYGFIWINVSTASSLYIAHNVGIMLANKVNFTTITTFFSLLTFFLGCSCTSVLEMFLCHYYFTNKLKISSLMPMLSISGYIQIPFAICIHIRLSLCTKGIVLHLCLPQYDVYFVFRANTN